MRRLLSLFTLAMLGVLATAKPANADVFVYDFQLGSVVETVHVNFTLPSFEQNVIDQTVFNVATCFFISNASGPCTVTNFGINGGLGDCEAAGSSFPGPCWVARVFPLPPFGILPTDIIMGSSPPFNSLGTFISRRPGAFTTIVTITDVAIPEPATGALLLLGLVGTGLVAIRRR